jgi:hypothetical protein
MVLLNKVKLKARFAKENIMPALKIFGKRIGGPKEEDMSKRISGDDKIAPNFDVPKRASRVDFSEMTSKGPNMGKVNKVTKKEVAIETPTGDIGSVVREGNPEAIGPNMGAVIKDAVVEKEMDLQEKARKSMGFKKGGKVKSKAVKMASGGKVSQLAKANGIAVRGKTRGKIC